MNTNHRVSLAFAIAAAAALAGAACASGRGSSRTDSRPIAKDPVCQYFRELGCVDVRVDADTPRAEYNGATYYFCCEHCKELFLENPNKYVR